MSGTQEAVSDNSGSTFTAPAKPEVWNETPLEMYQRLLADSDIRFHFTEEFLATLPPDAESEVQAGQQSSKECGESQGTQVGCGPLTGGHSLAREKALIDATRQEDGPAGRSAFNLATPSMAL